MGNFSNNATGGPDTALTRALAAGYSKVRIEQGVPILDRDLNLMAELPAARLMPFLQTFGDGIEDESSFQVRSVPASETATARATDFIIGGGACYVGGQRIASAIEIRYGSQAGVTPLAPLTAARDDLAYLDVSALEVDDTRDPTLLNLDVGLRTAVRVRSVATVRVVSGSALPSPPSGHAYFPLALLRRGVGSVPITILDRRRRFPHMRAPTTGALIASSLAGPIATPLLMGYRQLHIVGGIQVQNAAGNVTSSAPVFALAAKTASDVLQCGLETDPGAPILYSSLVELSFGGPRTPPRIGRFGAWVLRIQDWDDSNTVTVSLTGGSATNPAVAYLNYLALP